ncbi:Hsp20/alpha crystallin family protein [Legionella sp. W05-934-2]|jgi:HSP20 family protein|uniref:Hsp20/alpha crystallin family protein n=1 Tax=Legionella sp. W05-934-2 TaxID=1198649 RepID=UPI003462CA75
MTRMVTYDPMGILSEINRLFDNSGYHYRSGKSSSETSQWVPAVDVKENEKQYHFLMDLPGIQKKDVSVSMHDNILTIEGSREHETEETEKQNYYRYERSKGKFYRQFTLPESVDENAINATMKNGVLEIIIPKKEAPKAKTIDVKVEE